MNSTVGRTSQEFEKAVDAIGNDVTEFFERRFEQPVTELAHCGDSPRVLALLEGEGEIRWDGRRARFDRPVLIGPSTRVALVRMDGPVHLFGALLRPAAWADLCGADCIRLNDTTLGAARVLGREVDEVAASLPALPDFAARVDAATRYVRELRARHPGDPQNHAFARVVDRWLDGEDRARIETLVTLSGQSRRQVERQCKTLYGVPPRMIARRHRALRAARMLARATPVAEVIDYGFYDQSHLIRELKHFTGLTPRRVNMGEWTPKF